MAKTDYQSVDDYIAAQPKAAQPVLARVRATIRKALPGATEGISYQIPVYRLDGQMVLYFAGFQQHYSVYPATDRLITALRDELAGLLHSKATIRFPLAGAVPTHLIARIAKLRAAEAAERATAKANKQAAKKKAAAKNTTPKARHKGASKTASRSVPKTASKGASRARTSAVVRKRRKV